MMQVHDASVRLHAHLRFAPGLFAHVINFLPIALLVGALVQRHVRYYTCLTDVRAFPHEAQDSRGPDASRYPSQSPRAAEHEKHERPGGRGAGGWGGVGWRASKDAANSQFCLGFSVSHLLASTLLIWPCRAIVAASLASCMPARTHARTSPVSVIVLPVVSSISVEVTLSTAAVIC
jgi:hypothetical protein